jgi:hypothetical protein
MIYSCINLLCEYILIILTLFLWYLVSGFLKMRGAPFGLHNARMADTLRFYLVLGGLMTNPSTMHSTIVTIL